MGVFFFGGPATAMNLFPDLVCARVDIPGRYTGDDCCGMGFDVEVMVHWLAPPQHGRAGRWVPARLCIPHAIRNSRAYRTASFARATDAEPSLRFGTQNKHLAKKNFQKTGWLWVLPRPCLTSLIYWRCSKSFPSSTISPSLTFAACHSVWSKAALQLRSPLIFPFHHDQFLQARKKKPSKCLLFPAPSMALRCRLARS